MLVCWVVYKLKLPLWNAPKIGARKLSFPYIFVAGVQLYVFTLLRLTVNSRKKHTSRLHSSTCRVRGRNIRFRRLRTCAEDFEPPGFFFASFSITTNDLACLFGDCLLYLFIYLFNFSFLWIVQLCYIYFLSSPEFSKILLVQFVLVERHSSIYWDPCQIRPLIMQ